MVKTIFSVVDPAEVPAVLGLAGVVDVKDAAKGPMEAPSVKTVKKVVELVGGMAPVSVALGEISGRGAKGIIKLAVSMSGAGADILKVCVSETSGVAAAPVLHQLRQAVPPHVKLVGAGYADPRIPSAAGVEELPYLAAAAGFEGVLVDTRVKNGRSVFTHLGFAKLSTFIIEAKMLGLFTAVSGCLDMESVLDIQRLQPDYAGFRSAVALNGRAGIGIDAEKVAMLIREFSRGDHGAVMAG
ncbi:MAG: hypothetical protein HZB29_06840 [Nitrospinae bacterium]|nr:hypothetical protein [Nitrospinota bacterium]